MSRPTGKDDERATITELVATAHNEGGRFFQKASSNNKNNGSDRNRNGNSSKAKSANNQPKTVNIQDRLREGNMLVAGSDLRPRLADEYRRIKRPLLSNAFGKTAATVDKGNLLLVTSSIPGEGKTHTAINLALSIANERDKTVLLVDCDVTRYGASRLLGIADKPGLVDILEDDAFSINDAIMRTDVPELSLISAGKQHEFVTELLASRKMSDFVKEIGERYDDRIIIFDGPPLLPTPQTQVLSELVGQVVFVVEAGKTPQELVDEALSMISEEQATGLVMNKSEGSSGRGEYYYGYYSADQKN